MTIKIFIECPACHQQHDIFLKKKAQTIIFPCNECGSLISHSPGHTSIVKENLLEKIENMKTVDDLQAVFDIINAQIDLAHKKNIRKNVISESDIKSLKKSLDNGDFWVKYMGQSQ